MANTFSRWIPATFPLFDTQAKLRLRAFNKREAPIFKASVAKRFEKLTKLEGETDAQHEARSVSILGEWMDLAKDAFGRWVRLDEPLRDAESELEITTGAQLYEEAPGDFVLSVMLKLAELASLGDTEGNASGSRSTSTVEAGQATTGSPASIIDDTGSQPPSTATETQTSPEPFMRLA